MSKLSPEEIDKSLQLLEGWSVEDGVLRKDYGFKDFRTAIVFMTRLAPTAEKLNHHPEWTNSYNRVLVKLITHSAGALTKNDFVFAKAADSVAHDLQK